MHKGVIHSIQDVNAFDAKPYTNKPILIFVYMVGCPYCEYMKDEWAKLKRLNNKVNMLDINSSVQQLMMERNNNLFVDKVPQFRFPSIMLHNKDGTAHAYNGERSSRDFMKFIDDTLEKNEVEKKTPDSKKKTPDSKKKTPDSKEKTPDSKKKNKKTKKK